MSTAISVLGGVGLFLIGMTVMTGGLKALAGSALRTVLGKAAAIPLRGSFWGALVRLLVQSSSAITMTTIGLVSAGCLRCKRGHDWHRLASRTYRSLATPIVAVEAVRRTIARALATGAPRSR